MQIYGLVYSYRKAVTTFYMVKLIERKKSKSST